VGTGGGRPTSTPDRRGIRIVLARFEDIVTRGLGSLIDEDARLELVASEIPQDRLTSTFEVYRPDVAILNFGLLDSPAELRELDDGFPEIRLLVLADHPTPSECRQMLAFGATACLAKDTEARDILHSIHLASRGLHVLPPAEVPAEVHAGPEPLTPREGDVFEYLQSGSSNAEIAAALQISVETVRTHARRIYRKLGVNSRRELRSER
jgi:two-component system response regulator DesR